MNEAETRTHYILPALQKAGWGVVAGTRIREEYPVSKGALIGTGRRAKPDSADYVLVYQGRNVAVIEAKSDEKPCADGVAQAKDYANRLSVRFTYSSNGVQIYAIDLAQGLEAEVFRYPSPDELWQMTLNPHNDWQDKLLAVPYEDKGGLWQVRPYQDGAIIKALTAIANRQKRLLLTLATGTGKTAIAFQIVWKLFQARWNLQGDGLRLPRVLFLADRNLLADQAFNAFAAFEEEALIRITPQAVQQAGRVPTHGSVFFTIFQSFMTQDTALDEAGFRFGQYPCDFFDLIIIDECHRGGAKDESTWRGILEYFSDATQLGLTATPKRKINADTYAYFGEPVYVYSLKEGINEGYLTPFRIQQIQSNLDDYTYDGDDIVVVGEVEIGDTFSQNEFNTGGGIIIKQREIHRIKTLLKLIKAHEKTLIFCKTQAHAGLIRDLINQHSTNRNADYCHRVTAADGKIGDQHLSDFKDNEKTIPTILTTSQKLSTGVDVPELRNIVLMRGVNSMIEFKQIIGRGTRLSQGKDYFTIYDFAGVSERCNDPDWDGEAIAPEPLSPCKRCQSSPCICEKPPAKACDICGLSPCQCTKEPPQAVEIKLRNGTKRIVNAQTTQFWGIDGKPMNAQDFINALFDELPNFFTNEAQLRDIWAKPDTRKILLNELNSLGYSDNHLETLQVIINAKNSDLYDVLTFVAFNKQSVKRSQRVDNANVHLNQYNASQKAFVDFILNRYIKDGVGELAMDKLPDLLNLQYGSIADASYEIGDIKDISAVFAEFQQYLYKEIA